MCDTQHPSCPSKAGSGALPVPYRSDSLHWGRGREVPGWGTKRKGASLPDRSGPICTDTDSVPGGALI